MDQPGLSAAEHAAALRGLRRIHQFSGTSRFFLNEISGIMKYNSKRPLRIIDMACGGGDLLCSLAHRFKRRGWAFEYFGCDFSPQAVGIASENARKQGVAAKFFEWNALAGPLPEKYDILINSLFLHHLDEEDVISVLRNMSESAQTLLVEDLIRSRWGYGLAWAGCRALSRSPVVHYDGPVSVQGAFTLNEIQDLANQAGLTTATVQKHWPERFLLKWQAS